MEDPNTPSVELRLGEKSYQLCYTFAALIEAKRFLRKEGVRLNLLLSLATLDIDVETLPALFYAGLLTHQPEIDYGAASAMLNMQTARPVFAAICDAYTLSIKAPGGDVSADPPPAESKG